VKLPTKIKIGCRTCTVGFLTEREAVDHKGYHNSSTGVLMFDPNLDDEDMVNTVLHEILHGLWREYDLPDEDEEHCVITLANGLQALMQDNPKLFTMLEGREEHEST